MFCPRCAAEVADNAKSCTSCGMDLAAITEIAREKSIEQADEFTIVQEALRDEYEVIGELGRGGMAVVFKARDLNLEREVAVKVLPLSMAYDQEFVTRFQREARTAAKLEHPNIIPIYRVGKTGRVIYFIMKFLRGGSLNDIIESRGAMPPEDIRRILAEAADALGYAHENGIVHRDIKPDNIVFDEKGRSIVTDFGIAKAATGTRLTGTGMAIGTPYYMSPEQARAQDLDGRSDIYSLGVVAYQCLTGRVPFEGDDSFAVGIKHISEPLPTPELQTEAQRELFDIIAKMMEKEPTDRYQATGELVAALRGGLATQAVSAVDPGIQAVPPHLAATTPASYVAAGTPATPLPSAQPAATAPSSQRRVSPALLAVIGILAIGGGGAAVMKFAGGESADEPADPEPRPVATAVNRDSTTADTSAAQPDAAATPDSTVIEPDSASGTDSAATDTPEPEPPPPPNPRLERWRGTVAAQVRQFENQLADQGFATIGIPIIARLADGDQRDHTVTFRTEREYVLVGTCEAGECEDLDLSVYSPNGRLLDQDTELDARPVLQFSPTETAQYRVEASMLSCDDRSGCYYSVSFFARERTARPRETKRN